MQTAVTYEAPGIASLPEQQGKDSNSANLLWSLLVVICCSPMLYFLYIIETVGGNALSNDYVAVVYMIDRLLSSTVTPLQFIQEAYVGSHWMPLSLLVHFFNAIVFHWNARVELIFGMALAAARVCALYWLVKQPSDTFARRAILASILLALTFSLSQASVFLFGQATIPINLTLLFFTLGLVCLRKNAPQVKGVALMSLCGVAACASFAAVPQTWLSLLVAMPLLGYRKPLHYLPWLAGAALSALPYTRALSMVQPGTHSSFALPNLLFLINALGRPFANGIGFNCGRVHGAELVAVFGLLGLAVLACLRLKSWIVDSRSAGKEQINRPAIAEVAGANRRSSIAIVLVTYGLTSALVLSCVRQYAMPWYTSFSMLFWIGLVLLPALTRHLAGAIFVATIAIIYILTNKSYEDKQIYMYTRSPASESVLRNYATAPTYGEGQLFQWGDGNPMALRMLAEPLNRYRLSASSPEQEWALQGDFVLDSVRVGRAGECGDRITWIAGNNRSKVSTWGDFKHLNLCIPAGAEVIWRLNIPENALSVDFETLVFPPSSSITGCSPKIVLREMQHEKTLLDASLAKASQKEVRRSLLECKGKQIELVFSSRADYAVFRYPTVRVILGQNSGNPDRREDAGVVMKRKPSNTDLAGIIPVSDRDLVLPAIERPDWSSSNVVLALTEKSKMIAATQQSSLPSVSCTRPINARLGDYSHLFARMEAPAELAPRSLKARIDFTSGASAFISIPLLEESGMHSYTYDFKLLETGGDRIVKNLTLFPVSLRNQNNQIKVDQVRLLSTAKESTAP